MAGCSFQASDQSVEVPEELPDDYPNAHLLVTPEWLAENLEDPNLRIVDMRSPGEYQEGHIPGAVNVPIGDITENVGGIPFEIDQEEVSNTLDRIGLTPEMTVILYDDLGMMNSGRFFWTLEVVGHTDARILHGGWDIWKAGNQVTTSEIPEIEPTEYPIRWDSSKLVSAEQVLARLDDPEVVILDARSPQEYTGEVSYSDRGGHIPGAINLVWLDTLTGGDTVYTTESSWQEELQDEDIEIFKSGDEIQALLNELDVSAEQQAITYCQTLWRGSHLYFLLRLMGFEEVSGYDGSWAEWGSNPDLPVLTGDMPGQFDNDGAE